MKYLAVKNFAQFQHYKDRRPPWIKLYQEVLDDYAFTQLPDAARGQLMMIWLIASRTDNKIPNDPQWIARAIQASGPLEMDALLEAGFLEEWEPEKAKGKREDWSSRYIPDEVRERVMERCKRRCVTCASADTLEIDHIVPISKGGTGAEENLQVLCRSCNRKKRAALSADAERDATQMRSPEAEGETESETDSSSSTVRATEEEIARCLPNDADRIALTALLHRVPNRPTWLFEIAAALNGMHGTSLSPAQLGQVLRDFVGNGASAQPNLRVFRGYIRNGSKPPPEAHASPDDVKSKLDKWAKQNA